MDTGLTEWVVTAETSPSQYHRKKSNETAALALTTTTSTNSWWKWFDKYFFQSFLNGFATQSFEYGYKLYKYWSKGIIPVVPELK